MLVQMQNKTKRPLFASCALFALLLCGAGIAFAIIASRIADHFGRIVFERPAQSQLFTEMVKDGLKANLNSENRETQLEAVADLAWAVEVNPQDIPFAMGFFFGDLTRLSKSQDSEVATAANELLEKLRGVK